MNMKYIPDFAKDITKNVRKYLPTVCIVQEARTKDGVDGRVVAYVDRCSRVAEQFKTLRTNLYSLSPQRPLKTIVITSGQPDEGKTTTCCNLAAILSLDKQKKVLLIDADLRKPAVHSFFGLPLEPGFADVLSDKEPVERFTAKPMIEDLFIIPAGSMKDDPTGIMNPSKLELVVNKLRPKFDYILFDTPPVLEFTDACILGSICDAVIPVVKAGVTQENFIEETFNLLEGAQARPKACILINSPELHDLFYKYHYYSGKKE